MNRTLDIRVAAMNGYSTTEALVVSENIEAMTQEQIDALMVSMRPRLEELRDFVRMTVAAVQQQLDLDGLLAQAERS